MNQIFTTGDTYLKIPIGQLIRIGSTGKYPTSVSLRAVYPILPHIYDLVGTLLNSAQTFGPYTQERVIRISCRRARVEYDIGTNPQLIDFDQTANQAAPIVANFTTPEHIQHNTTCTHPVPMIGLSITTPSVIQATHALPDGVEVHAHASAADLAEITITNRSGLPLAAGQILTLTSRQ